MKMGKICQLVGLLLVTAFPAFSQIQDIKITATKKKLDEQKQRAGGPLTVTSKEIVYSVDVQNKRFSAVPEILVKYMIFVSDAQGGSAEKAVDVAHTGSETLKNVRPNATATFETKPFVLTREQLDPGVIHMSGAANRVQDKVNGVWIRAYIDGKVIGEFASPTTVSKKNEWKE